MNLAIDLDGTLVRWNPDPATWGTAAPIGEWLPGAREALALLLEQGHKVIVHSCRATWPAGGGWEAIARLLEDAELRVALVVDGPGPLRDDISRCEVWHELHADGRYPDRPLIGIWLGQGKPVASWYIDDNAIPFRGSWDVVLAAIA